MLKRILFVDDDTNFLESMKRTMRPNQEEWEISYFSSGLAAIQALKTGGRAVIVTDWNMPVMDGMKLCRHVRELEDDMGLKDCYLILLTGNQGVSETVKALDEGADDFINKPCDARELMARINVGFRIMELQNDLRRANHQLEVFANSVNR